MAISTRHMHRQHLRAANNKTNPNDNFEGGSNARTINSKTQSPSSSLGRSTAVLDALSDENSELARFLFVKKKREGTANNNDGDGGWFGTGDGDEEMKRMGVLQGATYSLALEPLAIRSEKAIQAAEAITIFGALFLGGTYILFEWGSNKAYGGDGSNEIVNRLFAATMATAICCNIFLAFFGSFLWILSIFYSSTNESFVFEARKLFNFCNVLLLCTLQCVNLGLFLGIYSNLSPHWAETIAVLVIAFIIGSVGQRTVQDLVFAVNPIDVYHLPLWARIIARPSCVFTKNGKEQLRLRAKHQAEELKKKAYHERKRLDPSFDMKASRGDTSIGVLLRNAAISLGRDDHDVSIYGQKLEEDWYTDTDQLRGMDVDTLSRYMPRLLAQKVSEVQSASIASGCFKQGAIYLASDKRVEEDVESMV